MTTPPPDPSHVVRSYLASFASGDPDRICAHVSHDFSNEHTAALGAPSAGAEEYRRRLPGFLADFDDLSYEVVELLADADRVVVRYMLRARWRQATPVELSGCMWFHLTDGLITRRIDHWDSQVFLAQIEPGPARS